MVKGKALVNEWSDFLQTGNSQSFYVLYGHYHDYLTFIGIQRGAAAQKIKDHINDLFLYIFEHRDKLSHIKHHHNYLVTSFIRSLIHKEKFSSTDSIELNDDNLPEMPFHPSSEALFIQQNAKAEIKAIVQDYMAKLSDKQSRMVYQKFYLGLPYQEIAESNNVSVKTAYNTILQSIAKLKKLMPPEQAAAIASAITLLGSLLIYILCR